MLYIKIFYNILTLNMVECQLSSIPGMNIISYWSNIMSLGHIKENIPGTEVKWTLFFSFFKVRHPKGNQSWIFIGGPMLKLKLQYFGYLMWKADSFIGKDPDAGKDWRREEKGTTEDEMVGWHHRLNRQEFE